MEKAKADGEREGKPKSKKIKRESKAHTDVLYCWVL